MVGNAIGGNGTLDARGSCDGVYAPPACNLVASPGRIRLEAFTFTRTAASDPPDTRDVPGLLFVPNLPGVRIATVAGQTVPLVPTGNADVTLPVTTVNPVTVTFATTNVPVGNTVKLTVVPAKRGAHDSHQ